MNFCQAIKKESGKDYETSGTKVPKEPGGKDRGWDNILLRISILLPEGIPWFSLP
jgi:hypothetical protein